MMSLQMADEREAMRSKRKFDPRSIPAVREVLDTLEEGSAVEGLARIAMLISKAGRGRHRLSQMQKTRELLSPEGEIAHLSRMRAGACCRRRRSSSISSRSARSARCRSSCAPPRIAARACASRVDGAAAGARGSPAQLAPELARCCRSRRAKERRRATQGS
jgi:hypothetical protein